MDSADGGQLGSALPDKVLKLDGNLVFEINLGREGYPFPASRLHLNLKLFVLYFINKKRAFLPTFML